MNFVLSQTDTNAQREISASKIRNVHEIKTGKTQRLRRTVHLIVVLFCISPVTTEIGLLPISLWAAHMFLVL